MNQKVERHDVEIKNLFTCNIPAKRVKVIAIRVLASCTSFDK
jgi:hypothetical protein